MNYADISENNFVTDLLYLLSNKERGGHTLLWSSITDHTYFDPETPGCGLVDPEDANRWEQIVPDFNEMWEHKYFPICEKPEKDWFKPKKVQERSVTRWKKGSRIKNSTFFSTLVTISFMGWFYPERDGVREEIAEYCMDVLEIKNLKSDWTRIEGEKYYFEALVLAAGCRAFLNTKIKNRKDTVLQPDPCRWYEQFMTEQKKKADLDEVKRSAVLYLWEECRKMGGRYGSGRDPYREETQLCDLYVIPRFSIDGREQRGLPLEEGRQSLRLVEAPVGYGKSTMLQSVILCCIYEYAYQMKGQIKLSKEKYDVYRKMARCGYGITRPCIPLFLTAEQINRESGCRTLEEIVEILMVLNKEQCLEMEKQMHRADEENRLLLIIDAVDEIKNKTIFYKMLGAYRRKFPQSSLMITSRSDGKFYKETAAFNYIERWELLGFTDELAKELTGKIFAQLNGYAGEAENEANKFFKQLKENPYLSRLIYNPFMLTSIILNKREESASKIIYSVLTNTLYKKYRRTELSTNSMRFIMARTAYELLQESWKDGIILYEDLPRFYRRMYKSVTEVCADEMTSDTEWEANAEVINIEAGLLIPDETGFCFPEDGLLKNFLAAVWIAEAAKRDQAKKTVNSEWDYSIIASLFDSIKRESWAEVSVMFFSIIDDVNSSAGRKDDILTPFLSLKISRQLLDYVFLMMARDVTGCEIRRGVFVLKSILNNTFGSNAIIKPGRGKPNRSSTAMINERRMILKNLLNNWTEEECLCCHEIFETYSEDIRDLEAQGLVQVRGSKSRRKEE